MQVRPSSLLSLFACFAIICASAGTLAVAADIIDAPDNRYMEVDLQQTLTLVVSGDPVVIYFRSPT